MESIPVSRLPGIGTRVRLKHAVDRYPHFLADAGMEGSVVHTPSGDPSGTFCVRMDETLEGAEEWDNEIVWSVGDGDNPLRDLEVIEDVPSTELLRTFDERGTE
jgi:hypothetical protein